MHQEQIFNLVRKNVVQMLAGYVQHENILESIDSYIVAPGLGDNPGIIGAGLLGKMEYDNIKNQ